MPLALTANELLDYLKGYEGRWVGDYTIHSTANNYTESFPVEQRYWWVGEVLHGISVSERDRGMETATSKTTFDGEKLIAEVKRGTETETYFGVLKEGALLWISSDLRRANDYQMREILINEPGEPRKMKIEGFDTYITGDGLAHIIFKGRLTLQVEEAEPDKDKLGASASGRPGAQ